MVLFKRKPVQFVPRPAALYEDQDIWVIDETDEIFTNYDDYVARMDYYRQKRFICEITGLSGLDFFEALRNEIEVSQEVDNEFPDALREPILRKVQHSTISRIDQLVDHVYDAFKDPKDIVEGERVVCTVDDPGWGKLSGRVREKVSMAQADNSTRGYRFFISLDNMPDKEALVDDDHIWRERKTFTKQILRSYLKNSVSREAWSGAPWLVKDYLAAKYGIETKIPPHLTYDYQLAQRKLTLNHKKAQHGGTILNFFPPNGQGLPQIKPKGHKKMALAQTDQERDHQFQEYQRALSRNPDLAAYGRTQAMNGDLQYVNGDGEYPEHAVKGSKHVLPLAPPPPVIKYPREDLENPPQTMVRPGLKFLSDNAPKSAKPGKEAEGSLHTESVGLLLETWDILNVYCEVFSIDSFTFDDYVGALEFQDGNMPCELITEIHCAVLKKLVNADKDQNGRVQINLPDEESSEEESSIESTPTETPTPEPEKPARTTRGSLAKSEAAELKAQAALDAKIHRAAEIDQCVKGYGWKARLRKRDFANGRWVVIIVGLMNLYASKPRYKPTCDPVLAELAPLSEEPTEETAIEEYAELDVNLRVWILQFLCMLCLETQAIRNYMEDCTASMTQFRKEKIEWQRKRKAILEDLKALEQERRTLQPNEGTPSEDLEEIVEAADIEMKDAENEVESAADSSEEDVAPPRNLRKANERAQQRKRKMDEDRKRKDKAETEKTKKANKEARQLEKVLKKIEDAKDEIRECEEEIDVCDNDLRESDCPRTRVLGKDRFWNRYYWFERNAMPYGGLPDSSTAHAGYANGCVWVQGPDDVEREGFIDLSETDNARYKEVFGVTVPQRKLTEEGNTHTFTARQWGYLDTPEDLDRLIGWLNDKGVREIKLRKELLAQKEHIMTYMKNRQAYLRGERQGSAKPEPASRMSTRRKDFVDPEAPRFLTWRNTAAIREEGHLHSEPGRQQRKGVARPVNGKKQAVVEDEGRQTRASARQTRQPSRQGTRYNF